MELKSQIVVVIIIMINIFLKLLSYVDHSPAGDVRMDNYFFYKKMLSCVRGGAYATYIRGGFTIPSRMLYAPAPLPVKHS